MYGTTNLHDRCHTIIKQVDAKQYYNKIRKSIVHFKEYCSDGPTKFKSISNKL